MKKTYYKNNEVHVEINTDLTNEQCKDFLKSYEFSQKENELLKQGHFVNIRIKNDKGFNKGFGRDMPDAKQAGRPLTDGEIENY